MPLRTFAKGFFLKYVGGGYRKVYNQSSLCMMWSVSFKISLGAFSTKEVLRSFRSNDLICWQRIDPLVFVRSSKPTLSGKFAEVFEIGQTSAMLLSLLNKLLLPMTAGLLPCCSKPLCGLKSMIIMSPCFA